MLHRTYDQQNCSIARALEVVGERWTLLILRDAFVGMSRFEEFRADLGVSRNVLTTRLERLVDEGVLERRRYRTSPERFEYVLTETGRQLWPVLVALQQWGDRYRSPSGPPVVLHHERCGGTVRSGQICVECGETVEHTQVTASPGPGA